MLEKAANPPASMPYVIPGNEMAGSLAKGSALVAVETSRCLPRPTPSNELSSTNCKMVAGPAVSKAGQTEAKGMLHMLAEKENAPLPVKKDVYGFTPSNASNPLVTQPYDSGYVTTDHAQSMTSSFKE